MQFATDRLDNSFPPSSFYFMRIGQNPAKSINAVAQPKKVTVTMVTHVPFVGGYHQESLDILEASLTSLSEHTQHPYDLMVFDNASGREVREYLLDAQAHGRIQYLLLSEQNVGKAGAWNVLFGAAQGEYVAYADSDVYFYPGWLSALMQVMEVFPKAGMITGMPLLNPEEFSSSTLRWAGLHPEFKLERGHLLPWDDFWRHAGTLGGDQEKARAFYDRHESICLYANDHKYYVGAGHFQFLAPRKVLQQVLPIPSNRPMGEVRQLDIAIDESGYLRLSTSEWWVEHIGNSLRGWHPQGNYASPPQAAPHPNRVSVWTLKPIRKLLTYLHNKTFDLLNR
jgi:hypothetical protein